MAVIYCLSSTFRELISAIRLPTAKFNNSPKFESIVHASDLSRFKQTDAYDASLSASTGRDHCHNTSFVNMSYDANARNSSDVSDLFPAKQLRSPVKVLN